jgi:excinuclease ABC subunit C
MYFGPYVSSAAARAALEFVEKKFGLRKCAVRLPDEETHRHCLNDIIRFCSAPCLGKIPPAAYRARLEEALAFLRGARPALLDELRVAMDQAAVKLDFERAAVIRDALHLLSTAVKERARLVHPRGVSAENALAGVKTLQQLLGLKQPPLLIEAVDISNISGKHAVGSLVAAVAGVCRPALYRRFRITTRESANDPAMMAEVVSRHFKRLKTEGGKTPELLLVDGGITQLRAAQTALRRLGINSTAAAGLAKKFEEIHVEAAGRARRLTLPGNSPALQVLQRLRDEAHRFAHAYHQRLRAKLIRESVLDEIPGLGARRKQELITRFGSARAIARASERKIAAVPGVGPALARRIRTFLTPSRRLVRKRPA